MHRLIALVCLALLAAPAAMAQTGLESVRLLPGWRMEGGGHMAGIDLRLQKGWKTYWRHPGEAGLPPVFDWSGSTNVAAVRIHWPAPEVFRMSGLRSIGYHDGVTLPLEITPRDPARPVDLRLTLDIGVCRDVCIPVRTRIAGRLPGATGPADPRIRAALADRPTAGAARAECRLRLTPGGLELQAMLPVSQLGQQEEVVIEPSDPRIRVEGTRAQRANGALHATARLRSSSGAPMALDRARLRMTVIGQGRAVEFAGCD